MVRVEKLKSSNLFIVARHDANDDGPRVPKIREQYEKAPQPKAQTNRALEQPGWLKPRLYWPNRSQGEPSGHRHASEIGVDLCAEPVLYSF